MNGTLVIRNGQLYVLDAQGNLHPFTLPTNIVVSSGGGGGGRITRIPVNNNGTEITNFLRILSFIGGVTVTQSGDVTTVNIPAGSAPISLQATATATITTSSNTDVVATGMTLTPPAGTYLVWFSGSAKPDTTVGGNVFMSIYAGGVQIPSSEENLQGAQAPFASVAKVTVDGTQTIEGRWRVDIGTATMKQRNLTILATT